MRKRRRERRAEQRQAIDLADPPLSPPPVHPMGHVSRPQYATSQYDPYHPVNQHTPSQTAFDGSTYRSNSTDLDSGPRTPLGHKGRDWGYLGSSPNGEMAESEARSTWFSTASVSSAPGMSSIPSAAGWHPSNPQGSSNQLRLVNESAAPPPDYNSVVGGSAQPVAAPPEKGPSTLGTPAE